jgi:hypothetical protein
MKLPPKVLELLGKLSPQEAHGYAVETNAVSILDLLDKCPWFHGANAADWTAWRAFLAATFALPMTDEEVKLYRRHTGRTKPPRAPASEAWVVAGRRSRKSAIAALIGVYIAAFRDHSKYLAPGERAVIPIIAQKMDEAQQIRAFAYGILTSHPLLQHLLEKEPTGGEIQLTTRCNLSIQAASHMAGRSKNVPCFLGDEIAFYPKRESAHPDEEILAAIRGGMALVPNPLVVGLSSPFAKEGVLWDRYRSHFGRDSDVMVWQADSREMHDSPIIRAWASKFIADDPAKAKAEVQGQFRDDVAALVPEEVVLACVVEGREMLQPKRGVQYVGFVDPSGGQADSFALGIAHFDMDARKVVLDILREWRAPFEFDTVIDELCAVLRQYNVRKVYGDRYGGAIPAQAFRRREVMYHVADEVRSDLYKAILPLLNSQTVELLDSKSMVAQFCGLKRRVHLGGREAIDHPSDGHDDVCLVAAGAAVYADRMRRPVEDVPHEYQTTDEIVHGRMWGQAKVDVEGSWENPYAKKRRTA